MSHSVSFSNKFIIINDVEGRTEEACSWCVVEINLCHNFLDPQLWQWLSDKVLTVIVSGSSHLCLQLYDRRGVLLVESLHYIIRPIMDLWILVVGRGSFWLLLTVSYTL